jgi:hypothetical protein
MVGRFIIGKNNSFYRIIKNLDVLIIRGNFNKIKIPYKIGNLTIYGNYNKIEFLEGGEINFIKILGNNNEIFSPNVYRRNYIDRGLHNYFARLFNSPNRDRRSHSTRNNNNITTDNLEEKLYIDIPHDIKSENSNKCTLCDLIFLNFDKVKIFSCKKHIFHSGCLEEYMRTNTNSSKCPRCENNNNNLNESTSSINPPLNSGQNPRNNSENNHNNNSNNLNNDNDMSEEDENSDILNIDEDENEDLESIKANPLDKEIFDNLVISKIKDVEKLDNEKKQCAICLENYVKGDESIALPCIHIFHAKCIKTWLTSHNNCPSCKNEINYEMEDKNDEF